MARTTATNYTGAIQFPKATAATDLFKKEDVQTLAEAVDQHDHSSGKGLAIGTGTITSAMIADGTITGTDIATGTITSTQIADGTVDTVDLKDGSVTSAKILDGTIATGDLANAAVTNAKLASDTARASLLVNGGFEVWQRGNGPFSAQSAFTADRWQIVLGSGSTHSVSKVANGPPGSAGGSALQTVYTHSAASSIIQDLKISENSGLRGKVLTFSAWVYSTLGTAVLLQVSTDGTGVPSGSSANPPSSTWTRLSCTLSGPVPNDASYVRVQLTFGASCTALMTQAMLVVGSQAGDYAPLHPADDLARCLRYYEIIGETPGAFQMNQYTSAGNTITLPVPYKARKPVTPTVTKNGTWATANASGQPTTNPPGVDQFAFSIVAAALGAVGLGNNSPGCNFTVEANP